jgi:hypothetical protein
MNLDFTAWQHASVDRPRCNTEIGSEDAWIYVRETRRLLRNRAC